MPRASQSAVQSIMRSIGTRGGPNSATMRAALLSQPVGASLPRELRRPAEAAAELLGQPAHLDRLGARDVDGRGRRGGVRQAAQRHGVGIALPDHVDVAHGEIDGLAVAHLGGDVVQHAIAHVDGVVEPHEAAGRAEPRGEMLEHALAADAGVGVVAGRRDGRRLLGRAAALDGHERIDAARREGDDARGREDLGDDGRHMHVHGPGQRRIAGRAELHGRHEDDVGEPSAGRSTRVGGRADRRRWSRCPPAPAPSRTAGSEKRATPTTRLSGAARLAMRASVGPILPATPSTRMSPGEIGEIGDKFRRRRAQEILELGNGCAKRSGRLAASGVAIMLSPGARA